MLHNAAINSQPKSLLMWFMFRLDPSLLYNPEFTGLVFMKILFEPYHNTPLNTFKHTLETDENAVGGVITYNTFAKTQRVDLRGNQ